LPFFGFNLLQLSTSVPHCHTLSTSISIERYVFYRKYFSFLLTQALFYAYHLVMDNSIPLKPKQESFARAVVSNNGNIKEAYLETYKDSQPHSAKNNAPRLMANDSVRSRVAYLMDKANIGLKRLTGELGTVISDDDNRVKLNGVKLGFQLLGALDAEEASGSTHQHIHLHEAETAKLTPDQKLAKLRDLTR
jgi:hypothetical protein